MKVTKAELMTKQSSPLQLMCETLPLIFFTGVFSRFSFLAWEMCWDSQVGISRAFFGIIAGGLSIVTVVLALLSLLTLIEVIKDK